MKTWKIGVVGTIRGITFIELLQNMGERAELYAVCESDAELLEKAKDKIPAETKIYVDYDEFLDSGVEAVVLCNYFHEHASFAIKAMKKGIHVISDTTAAPTLGECVELCRTVESTGCKYMLGANGPFKRGLQFIKKEYENGKIGDVFYAEAEYLHYSPDAKPYEDSSTHWRRMMPGTYYNMHTLGSLMYITGTVPKKVTASVVRVKEGTQRMNRLIDHDGAKILCEMDNGAKFDVTGCAYYGPTSKWFRLMGEKGVIETERYDETKVWFASSGVHFYPDEPKPEIEKYEPDYADLNMTTKEEMDSFTEDQRKLGHGGIDFWLVYNFIKYLNGEHEPFFNVYRATALSAAGILGWRSVLDQSKEYDIPDFTKEEDKKKYENDFLSPFAEEGSENLISRKAR